MRLIDLKLCYEYTIDFKTKDTKDYKKKREKKIKEANKKFKRFNELIDFPDFKDHLTRYVLDRFIESERDSQK